MISRFTFAFLSTSTALALLSGCASSDMVGSAPKGPAAVAVLEATKGNTANGTVHFAQDGASVTVWGEVVGLKPGATHGFHVHEKGDCSSGDGMSTGGHFNPSGKAHGHHGKGEHHTGDLPSLVADAQGVAKFRFQSSTIAVGSTANDVVGHGLIVHRDPDDHITQPTGNSGPRLACGVIRLK